MHPLARPNNGTGLSVSPGKPGVQAGDRIILNDGRRGVADEFLHDGDAYVSLDDGVCATVRWNQISPEPGPPEGLEIPEDYVWPTDFTYDRGVYVPKVTE